LYAGLMIGSSGQLKVLEFNCRMGDPETQPILIRLKSDLLALLLAATEPQSTHLAQMELSWDRRVALGVVMAASGYPGTVRKGDVIHGLNAPLTRDAYATAIADGTLTQLLRHVPIHAGDTIDVPAGTIHAINAGVFLFEIQQTSDLTYRVYDYLRRDDQGNLRTLHIPQALAVSHLDNNRPAHRTPVVLGSGHEELVRSAYFVMERIQTAHAQHWTRNADSFEILTLIDGACVLTDAHGTHFLQRGDSIIIPADSPPYHMAPTNSATWLRCWVPDA
jgi:mannose-6-phosphate isomerase